MIPSIVTTSMEGWRKTIHNQIENFHSALTKTSDNSEKISDGSEKGG